MQTDAEIRKFDIQLLWGVYAQCPIPTIIVDNKARIIKYNDAMEALTGYNHREFHDFPTLSDAVFTDSDTKSIVSELEKQWRMRASDIIRTELQITRKNGQKRYVAFSVYDICSGRKRSGFQIIQGEDISERQTAEEELRKFKYIVESAQDALFLKDPESHYVYVNNKSAEAFGLPCETIIGKNDLELMPVREEALQNIEDDREVMRTGEAKEYIKHMTSSDGTEFWFQAIKVPQRNSRGEITGVVGIARDISELKKIEEKHRRAENKYKDLLDLLPETMCECDTNGKLIYVSQKGYTLFGYTKEDFEKGVSVVSLVEPEDRERAANNITKVLNGEDIGTSEYTVAKKDGTRLPVMIHSNAIEQNGTVVGFRSIAIDISEQKKFEKSLRNSEAELREQKIALEQKNIALREVIAQVEVEKNRLKDDITTNVNKLVMPLLNKLMLTGTSEEYIDLLRHNLERLLSSFGRNITSVGRQMTPREIEICSMIASGLSNKEVSRLLNITCNTVEKHRENIRKKIGISNKNINLASHLKQLQS